MVGKPSPFPAGGVIAHPIGCGDSTAPHPIGCEPMSLMPVNTWRSPLRALFASASRFEGNRARYVSGPMAAAFAAARSNFRFAFGKRTIPNAHALRAGVDVAG